MCFRGWFSPATPGVKGQAADVCVAVILVCARFSSGAPGPEQLSPEAFEVVARVETAGGPGR